MTNPEAEIRHVLDKENGGFASSANSLAAAVRRGCGGQTAPLTSVSFPHIRLIAELVRISRAALMA
jgi:hypothetical protein